MRDLWSQGSNVVATAAFALGALIATGCAIDDGDLGGDDLGALAESLASPPIAIGDRAPRPVDFASRTFYGVTNGGGAYLAFSLNWNAGTFEAVRLDPATGRSRDPNGIHVAALPAGWWPVNGTLAFDGTRFRLVWSAHGPNNEPLARTETATVHPDGTVGPVQTLRDNGFEIAGIACAPTGTCLVVGQDQWNSEIEAFRIDTGGRRVGRTIVIEDCPTAEDSIVSYEGGDFVIRWHPLVYPPTLNTTRISTSGSVRSTKTMAQLPDDYQNYRIRAASNSQYTLVTWMTETITERYDYRVNLYWMRFAASGTPLDAEPHVMQLPNVSNSTWHLSVVGAPSDFLVSAEGTMVRIDGAGNAERHDALTEYARSWTAYMATDGQGHVLLSGGEAARVDLAGGLTHPYRAYIFDPVETATQWQRPATAWTGASFLSIWRDERESPGGTAPYAARVAPSGEVLDAVASPTLFTRTTASRQVASLATASRGGRHLLATYLWNGYYDWQSGPDTVQAVVTDARGIPVGEPVTVARPERSRSVFEEPSVHAAAGDNGFLVAWVAREYWTTTLRVARLDAAGNVLDPGGTAIEASSRLRNVSVTWTGAAYLVLWTRPYNSFAMWLAPSGEVLELTTLAPNAEDVAAACAPDACLVYWVAGNAAHARRYDLSGHPLGGASTVSEYSVRDVATAWDGHGYVVVSRKGDNSMDLETVRYTAAGQRIRWPQPLATGITPVAPIALASDGAGHTLLTIASGSPRSRITGYMITN